MSENDYIAEYIKEKKPEIIGTIDFVVWKIGKLVSNTVKVVTETITAQEIANYINDQEGEDGQGDEEAQSASDAQ